MTPRAILLSLALLLYSGCGFWKQQQIGLPQSLSASKAPHLEAEVLLEATEQYVRYLDGKYFLAGQDQTYGTRVAKLSRLHQSEGSLDLNTKSYLLPEIQSFVLPDGSIRLSAGLLDFLNDDELRFILGHEIGHLALGHSTRRMEAALEHIVTPGTAGTDSASRELSHSELMIIEEAFNALAYSVTEEQEADRYALTFLSRNKYPVSAASSALAKLATLLPSQAFLRNHPGVAKRAAQLADLEPWNPAKGKRPAGAKQPANTAASAQTATLQRTAQEVAQASATTAAPAVTTAAGQVAESRTARTAVQVQTNQAPPARDDSDPLSPGWYVHVATEPAELQALATLNLLNSVNVPALLQGIRAHGTETFRVLVGPYATRAEAQKAARDVQAYGIAADLPPVIESNSPGIK